jgi:NADH-quinone oxidoreductase subunit G
MSEITLYIDGKEVKAKEGETILNIARANDIFIPAICYLNRCSATLACRLCIVDIDGKRAYGCNAKAKDGMNVVVNTEELQSERTTIMEVYDVNHPLECGVCDQSGECELQNYTLKMNVKEQHQKIKDTYKPAQDWGFIHYDPSLCIVCERCITVCKDMIGDSALKTVKRGGEEIDASFKDSMPKDAYTIWNKMNKSLIGLSSNGDTLDCSNCGECTSACPVGALVQSHFQYKSNAWELELIPSTCSHCPMGCQLKYETKHDSIENPNKKLYRVSNEFHYVSLCGAGRYGFDFENRDVTKDEEAFKKALEAFKKAKAIKFNSYITNEEALILQKLKEKFKLKLVNDDAYRFQEFMKSYSSTSGKSLYSTNLKELKETNFIISLGSMVKTDAPNVRYAINNSLTVNKGSALYIHPIGDTLVESLHKNITTVTHKPLQEEAILLLLIDKFAKELPSELKSYIDSFKTKAKKTIEETIKEEIIEKVTGEDGVEKEVKKLVPKTVTKEIEVDSSTLLAKAGLDDNFFDSIDSLLAKKETFALVVGEDLINHPNYKNIAKLIGIFERVTEFKLLVIPSKTNTLGVSLICDLDKDASGFTIGYNEKADFTLSSLDGDLDMPSLNQQEGTFVSVDKRVLPINVALPYGGYVLNDIAVALGIYEKYTIDYTKALPKGKGFNGAEFDNLSFEYSNADEDLRGYELSCIEVSFDDSFDKLSDIKDLEGDIIYLANPTLQFSPLTNRTTLLKDEAKLYVSSDFLTKKSLEENQKVEISNEFGSICVKVKLDDKLKGEISCIGDFDESCNSKSLFKDSRYSQVNIKRV